jgi:hypothetical protein
LTDRTTLIRSPAAKHADDGIACDHQSDQSVRFHNGSTSVVVNYIERQKSVMVTSLRKYRWMKSESLFQSDPFSN